MKNDRVMKRVTVIVGAIVLVAAGVCTWAYFQNAAGVNSGVEDVGSRPRVDPVATEDVAKQMVVYAVKDIYEGHVFDTTDLEEKEILASKAPESAIPSISSAVGTYASVNIAEGTIILAGHIKHASGVPVSKKSATKPTSKPAKKHKP